VGSSITITQQPVSISGPLPATAVYSVAARSTYAGQPNNLYSYVWQRNDGAGFADIDGAYANTYTVTLGASEGGAKFRCVVFSPGASAISSAAGVGGGIGLTISLNAGVVRVAWPASATGVSLYRATSLSGPPVSWTLVPPASYQSDATSKFILVPNPTGNAFYSLRSP